MTKITITRYYKTCPYCNAKIKEVDSFSPFKFGYIFEKCKKCGNLFISDKKEYFMLNFKDYMIDFLKLYFVSTMCFTIAVGMIFSFIIHQEAKNVSTPIDISIFINSVKIYTISFTIIYMLKRLNDIKKSKERLKNTQYYEELKKNKIINQKNENKI